ncbi:MAG: DUF2892 domain-containing protein [Verrucomicrobiae bacterium]|nr:DUF2892 domain-containing protein [Verrucomicrobiae bacterium]
MSRFFQPNITTTGRILRGGFGVILLAAAVCFYWVHLAACAVAAVAGVFCLFEAFRGWCVARACGLKTRW